MSETIAEIRARHEYIEAICPNLSDRTHQDRATLLRAVDKAQQRAERAEAALKATRPYRAEFGAIFHEDQGGFLFTVSSEKMATEVAKALNISTALRAAQTLKERNDG